MKTDNKVALITGANRGLGLEIARQLGNRQFTVLLGARDEKAGQEAANKLLGEGIQAVFISLDITNTDSVTKAAETIGREYGKLDVLVNNAGMQAPNQDPSQIKIALLQDFLNTNFVAHVVVTQTFLPLLRQSSAGRIVNMSSSIGSITTMGEPINTNPRIAAATPLGYSSSKAALNMFTALLAKELRATTIKVNSTDPGRTQTDMGGKEAPNTIEQGAKVAVWLACLDEDGPTGGFFANQKVNPW